MRKLILLFLVIGSVCFAQMESLNKFPSVFSAGYNLGYRMYSKSGNIGDSSNHITSGILLEANVKIKDNFYTGFGLGISTYTALNENYLYSGHPPDNIRYTTYSAFTFYLQPSIAQNAFNNKITFFEGIKGELIADSRFLGTGVSIFGRMQYNFSGACAGYHFGVQRFSGGEFSIRTEGPGEGNGRPLMKLSGYALINYFYIGIKL